MRQINLIPQEYIRQKHTRRRAAVWAMLLSMSAAIVGSLAFKLDARIADAKAEKFALEETVQVVAVIRAQLLECNAGKSKVSQHLRALFELQEKHILADLIHVVSQSGSDSVFLTEIRMGKQASSDPLRAFIQQQEPQRTETALVLKGYTLAQRDLTDFVSALTESGRFASVRLRVWRNEQIEDLRIVSFEIECEPAGIWNET